MKKDIIICIMIVGSISLFASAQAPHYQRNLQKGSNNMIGKDNGKEFVECLGVGLHDVGNLELLIDDRGGEEGWRFTHIWPISMSIDHLYWNWLAIGYSDNNVSDGWDGDWLTTPGGDIIITEPGHIADEEGYAQFNDSVTANGIEVTQESSAWADSPHDDYVILKYTIKNIGNSNISNCYVGHRSDFDVSGDHGGAPTDMSDFDNTRNLAYMWDISSTVHVGVKLLEGDFRGDHQGWHSADDPDKFYALSTLGVDSITPYPDDWCFWLSAGPYQIIPGDSVIVAFAFLAGEDLADLQANADAAQAKWDSLEVTEDVVHKNHSSVFSLSVYPNPFIETTNIRYQIAAEGKETSLKIFDASGRLVKDFSLSTSYSLLPTEISWDGRDDQHSRLSSGVYFLKLQAGDYSTTEKLLLIRR